MSDSRFIIRCRNATHADLVVYEIQKRTAEWYIKPVIHRRNHFIVYGTYALLLITSDKDLIGREGWRIIDEQDLYDFLNKHPEGLIIGEAE